MSLDIQQREHERIVILDAKGRITVGPEASALREKMAAVNASGSKNIILNLAHVDYIDSTGLGALVMCATSQRKASCPSGSMRKRAAMSARKRDTACESSSLRPGASPSQNGMVGGMPCASSTRTVPRSTRRMR